MYPPPHMTHMYPPPMSPTPARHGRARGPVRSMMEAGVDAVPGTVTTHEVPRAAAWHVRKRSEGRVVGEPEELMEESNMVLFRD